MFSFSEEGQGLMEYSLLLVFVAVVVITILTVLGDKITVLYQIATAMGWGGP